MGRTGLLPCHYAVHSLGSSAVYRVEIMDGSVSNGSVGSRVGAGKDGGVGGKRGAAEEEGCGDGGAEAREVGGGAWQGEGQAHLEANFGVAFPAGWCWVNAIGSEVAPEGEGGGGRELEGEDGGDGGGGEGGKGVRPRLTLTGGRFQIGPLSPR